MTTIRVFDPPLCCSSGVCGPSVDPELARIAADLAWLSSQGVTVERHNLAQEPGAFVAVAAVREALEERGNECLPLTLVDDRIAVEGSYPSRETLAALAGVRLRKLAVTGGAGGCCTPKSSSGSGTGCC
jgi:hypothetical protein